MIYWEELANNQYDYDWYQNQIQNSIEGRILGKSKGQSLNQSQSRTERTLGCLTSEYKQSALNSMVVGNVVGELVKHIKDELGEEKSYTTYCIGISLGAHLCGFVGKSSGMVTTLLN